MRQFAIAAMVAAAAGLSFAEPAGAQNTSADQIIRGLRPTAPTGTTRGIRPAAPADAPASANAPTSSPGIRAAIPGVAPRVTPSPTAAPTQTSPAPTVNLTVNFASGSADLTPGASRTLDELGRALTSAALAAYKFRIEGHTDTVGSAEANKALSDRRAAAVVGYLVTKWGVDRARVEAVGMGQEQLVVQTGPNVAQPRNRRVTVINLGA